MKTKKLRVTQKETADLETWSDRSQDEMDLDQGMLDAEDDGLFMNETLLDSEIQTNPQGEDQQDIEMVSE